jgi:hypothetical protein
VLTDAVITGHDGTDVSLDHPVLRANLASVLAVLADGCGSRRSCRPAPAVQRAAAAGRGGEHEKVYVNQRAVLDRRAELVARLSTHDPELIVRADREESTMGCTREGAS